MAYNSKTDWALNDTVQPADMNRIETGIAAVDTGKLDKTANAVSATRLQTARTIGLSGGVIGTPTSFNGAGNIVIPVTSLDATKLSGTANIPTTGNSGSATKLQTARTIGLSGVTSSPVSFDGSANVTIPVTAVPAYLVSGTLLNDTSGNSASATKLKTARTIALSGGVTGTATSFDGSINVTIPVTSVNPNNLSVAVPISKGGTGATDSASARTNIGAPHISQLTTINKYNTPTITKTLGNPQTLTATPIPMTGWVATTVGTEYTNSSYKIKTSSYSGTNYATLAVDEDTNTKWVSGNSASAYFQVELPTSVTLQKVKWHIPLVQYLNSTKIQGSTTGSSWVDLFNAGSIYSTTALTEVTLTTTGLYRFYRVLFGSSSTTSFNLAKFQFSSYIIDSYTTNFSVTGIPTSWQDNQRLLIYVPANYDYLGVTTNTLNTTPIDRILQSDKYYELRYVNNRFYAKEV